jgi:hypothetical protein
LVAGRAGAEPSLTFEQASTVFTPLAAARAQDPPLAEVYTLIADVWAACAQAPTRDQLAVLEQGVRSFPRDAELVYRTAALNVRHGHADTARWLITLGLTLAADDAVRTRLEELRSRISAAR